MKENNKRLTLNKYMINIVTMKESKRQRGRPKLDNTKIQIRTRKNDFDVFQKTFEDYKKLNPKATVGTFLIYLVNFYRMYVDLVQLPQKEEVKPMN